MLTPPLHELFEARHIAVVGASARMETAGGCLPRCCTVPSPAASRR